MISNIGFEENEISANSHGGTELSKRNIAAMLDPDLVSNFQIIPARVRDLNLEKIRILWSHDLPLDPESSHLKDESSRKKFHKFVFVSNWQYQQYIDKLDIPQDHNSIILENPIEPFKSVVKSKEEIRLIYFSTPHRGLEILVPVFEKLSEKYPNIHLDVFSSFKIYGWEEADKPFESLFNRCKNHPKIHYHGFQPNHVIREYLEKSHIFAYPSIWLETSCRCLIEAMSAGLLCVHPNYGALSETSGGLTSMYDMDLNKNNHAQEFYMHLENAISMVHNDDLQNYLKFVKSYADTRFNIYKISNHWNQLLRNLLEKYPTVESRSIQKEYFRYVI
jgi:glycosyltransferase involved in cell wall biosynthesis